jgi:MscS family membrane protein
MSDVSARRNDRWYVSLWRVAIIAIVAIVCLTGRNEAARADTVSWSGTWDTRWRESGAKMELTQRGAEVFGNYPVYGGRIEGKVEGRVLRGQWIEGARSGAITFVLAPDGQTFMGRFDTGEWWTGGRSNNQEASVPLDQTGAREALRTFIMAGNAVRSGALDEIGTAEAVVDFGPAGDNMAPGEKLAAARSLFELVDLTTVQLWTVPGQRAQGPSLVVSLAQAGTSATLPLTMVQGDDKRWFIAMPDAQAMDSFRKALLTRTGGKARPADDYLHRRSPRDALRAFAAGIADWNGAGREVALDALDLSDFSEATRQDEGQLAAQYINEVLSRVGAIIPQEVPDDIGSREPYLVVSHPEGRVVIAASGAGDAESWRFDARTVRHARDLFIATENMPLATGDTLPEPLSNYFRARRWVHDQVPALLARAGPLEAWQIIGVILLLAVAFGAAWLLSFILLLLLRVVVGGKIIASERQVAWPLRLTVMLILYRFFVPALGLPERASQFSVGATGVALALSVIWGGWKLIDALGDRFVKRAERSIGTLDDIAILLVLAALKIVLLAGGLLFVADALSLPYDGVVASLGIGGLAVAFASKETLSNVFGAALIATDRPFRRGDWINSGDVAGTVEHVGIRSTRIRTAADSLVFVPNGKLADATVNNLGTRRHRLCDLKSLLAYGTTSKQVDDFVMELANVVASVPSSVPSRTLISVNAMTTDGIELGLICYLDVATQAQELSARTTLNMGILRLAEKLGIVLGKRETAS